MGTLSGLFDMSRDALMANQAALNATANNVANQNTAGYTRQVVSFTAGDSVTIHGGGTVHATGSSTGPQVTTTSVRDRVLEHRIQQQTQQQTSTSAESEILSQIQNVFSVSGGATPGSTAIGTALNSFFSSLTALAGNPADTATQQGVLSAAQVVASTLNSAANQLQAVGDSLNGVISTSVTAANALTVTIASLNQQIADGSPHGDAGALEDKRQRAIDQLSQYVGLDQIATENNGITLTTTGGTVLVAGSSASALSASISNGAAQIQDSTGHVITAGIQGGSIGGNLKAQSVDLSAATTGLDGLAFQIASAVNSQNSAGLTTAGVAGGAIFAVPASASGAAAIITVIPASPSAIAGAGIGEGEGGNTNAIALANVSQTVNAYGQTIPASLSTMVAQIGSTASSLQEKNTAQQATLTQLTTQRDSLSAVSLDTEAANLSQYQRSYQAAAQLLTVLDRLMATAINLGQQTTVA